MRTAAACLACAIMGAAISAWYYSEQLRSRNADLEVAAQAYNATTATYVLTFVDALEHLRQHDTAEATMTLEERLERDLEFLGEPSVAQQDSVVVAKALAAGAAYRTPKQESTALE